MKPGGLDKFDDFASVFGRLEGLALLGGLAGYVSTPCWLIAGRRTFSIIIISPAAVALLPLALVLFALLIVVVRVVPAPGPVLVLVSTAPGPTLRLIP